jgi:hypothetical protein
MLIEFTITALSVAITMTVLAVLLVVVVSLFDNGGGYMQGFATGIAVLVAFTAITCTWITWVAIHFLQ